jgi:pilus assembly protein CpaF
MTETHKHKQALDDLAGKLRAQLLAQTRVAEDQDLYARIAALVDQEAGLLAEADRAELVRLVAERSFGLGVLEPLLHDATVDEVMVNGPDSVWIEREGKVLATDVKFASESDLRHTIERILAPLGRRVDEATPLVDARLLDGSRINVVIPPLSVDGPVLTIRRFRRRGLSAQELIELGTWDRELHDFLRNCVRARVNILVSGGTGSGKTTLLNALSEFIPPDERVVTIEDAAELRLRQPHVVRLEARPPSLEGRGEITIRRLVRNALRMRPDRIIVGEVRGGEALDMLSAMSTGHEGSLSTVHAGSPAEALRRVETLALMADIELPHRAISEQVASALDLLVHQERSRSGKRRILAASEVTRHDGQATARDLFRLVDGKSTWCGKPSEVLARRLEQVEA